MAGTSTSNNPDIKRALIADAARVCFLEHGFAATRIAEIAEHAGVGKGTVYEYYRSKEELLLAATLHACQMVEEDIHDALDFPICDGDECTLPESLHPVRAMHQLVATVIRCVLENTGQFHRLVFDLWQATGDNPDWRERARDELLKQYRGWENHHIYDIGVAQGYFRTLPDPEWHFRLLVAAIDGLAWQGAWRADASTAEIARRTADDVCLTLLNEPQRLQEFLA